MKIQEFDFKKFEKIRAVNEQKHREFREGKRKVLIVQDWSGRFTDRCNSKEELLSVFLDNFSKNMDFDTDHVPYLEPWHGTGIFANAFGCPVTWVAGASPWTSPVFKSAREVRDIKMPRPSDSELMNMVIETIRYFKEKTGGLIPICLTDTQSPFDTASLIMETNAFFTGLVSEPETIHHFIGVITDLVIEFSKIQQEKIGAAIIKPGHIMASSSDWSGISVSDDNVVMVSPAMYTEFSASYNARIGMEFGGVAVHSCGNWAKSAEAIGQTEGLIMIDAPLSKCCDPDPMDPEPLRETFAGTGIVVQVRIDYRDTEKAKQLMSDDMKVVFKLSGFEEEDSPQMRNKIVRQWRSLFS